jgi:hypothetical protein
MDELELGNIGSSTEVFGELGGLIDAVDQSNLVMQAALTEYVHVNPDYQNLASSVVSHANSVFGLLRHVLDEGSGYEIEEAGQIATATLDRANRSQIDFFRVETGELETKAFEYEFDDFNEGVNDFVIVVRHFEEEHGGREEAAIEISGYYNQILEDSINKYRSYFDIEIDEDPVTLTQEPRKHPAREGLIQAAATAAGVVIGGLILKAINRKK